MKQAIASLCSEFARKASYSLSFLPAVPNERIMNILKKDGWKLAPYEPTPHEIAAMSASLGRGALFLPQQTVITPDGEDVMRDDKTYEAFKQARRRAAAQVYGITL